MAITKDITLASGVELPNAYIKIQVLNMTTDTSVDVSVDIFKDQSAREDNKIPVVTLRHLCSNTYDTYFAYDILNQLDINVISQGYEFLKSLPFYEGAVDTDGSKE